MKHFMFEEIDLRCLGRYGAKKTVTQYGNFVPQKTEFSLFGRFHIFCKF